METTVDETTTPAAITAFEGRPVPEVGIAVGEEYRRDERYPVNGDAEVVVLGGTSLFRGRIMDISVSGCYIQTLAWVRLTPETPVEILFAVEGKVVRALAASRYVKSKVGIGFRFVKMNEDMQRKLDELINGARDRFMELTRQTRGASAPYGAARSDRPIPIAPVNPEALRVVAVREQERAASAPGGAVSPAIPATQRAGEATAHQTADASVAVGAAVVAGVDPAPVSASAAASVSVSMHPIGVIVEDAAEAVLALEQDAAGVQSSQMLEVSELSKVAESSPGAEVMLPSQPGEYLSNPSNPSDLLDAIAVGEGTAARQAEVEARAEVEAQAQAVVLMASAVHTFEIDEDASDIGHAEVWSASSDAGPWRLRSADVAEPQIFEPQIAALPLEHALVAEVERSLKPDNSTEAATAVDLPDASAEAEAANRGVAAAAVAQCANRLD